VRLKLQANILEKSIEGLSAEKDAAVAEAAKTKEEIGVLMSQLKSLQEAGVRGATEQNKLEADLREKATLLQVAKDEKEATSKAAAEKAASLEKEMSALQAAKEVTEAASKAAAEKAAGLEKEMSALQVAKEATEATSKAAAEKAAGLERELETAKAAHEAAIATLQSQNQAAGEKVASLESEMSALQAAKEVAEAASKAAAEKAATLEAAQGAEVERLKQAVRERDGEITRLNADIEHMRNPAEGKPAPKTPERRPGKGPAGGAGAPLRSPPGSPGTPIAEANDSHKEDAALLKKKGRIPTTRGGKGGPGTINLRDDHPRDTDSGKCC
jgi:chromosome segregation ATPase